MNEIVQRSAEWYAIRLGKATGSRVGDVCARTKTGYSTSRANYAAELVLERITGKPTESYVSAAMQYGIDTEPEARTAYEFRADCDVQLVGFVDHPTIPMSGASPDGLIGDMGMVEIKCPQPAAHLATLLSGTTDSRYVLQAQFQMACTGRRWVDLASYCPAFPEQMRLVVKRIPRDDDKIKEVESEVRAFLAEVEEKVSALRSRYMREAA